MRRSGAEENLFVAFDDFVALVGRDDELFDAAAHRQAAFGIALPAFPQVVEEPFFDAGVFEFQALRAQEGKRDDVVVAEQLVIDLQVFEADHALGQGQRLLLDAGDATFADRDAPHNDFLDRLRLGGEQQANREHASHGECEDRIAQPRDRAAPAEVQHARHQPADGDPARQRQADEQLLQRPGRRPGMQGDESGDRQHDERGESQAVPYPARPAPPQRVAAQADEMPRAHGKGQFQALAAECALGIVHDGLAMAVRAFHHDAFLHLQPRREHFHAQPEQGREYAMDKEDDGRPIDDGCDNVERRAQELFDGLEQTSHHETVLRIVISKPIIWADSTGMHDADRRQCAGAW